MLRPNHPILTAGLLAMAGSTGVEAADPYANAPAYARPVAPGVVLSSIVTVGQQIPLSGGAPGETFRIVGIPDGMGAFGLEGRGTGKRMSLMVNHELRQGAGTPFGTLPSGARISELVIAVRKGGARSQAIALSGGPAIERVYDGETGLEIFPDAGISRLCSAFLADEDVDFDRPVYLAGEEARSPRTFDGLGGLAFATFEGAAWTLPRFGRAPWENVVVAPFTDEKTVVMLLEDRSVLDSQLYMYVGEKDRRADDALSANGLNDGSLHVFAGDDPALNSGITFNRRGQSITGHWAPVNWAGTDLSLQAESVAADSFLFTALEDGAFDPGEPGVFYFTSTGRPSAPGNPLGKLYRMDFDPEDPLGPATLTIVLDGSEGVVSPDNIAVNRRGEMLICEDPTVDLSSLGLSRDTYLWFYDTRTGRLVPIVEMDRAGAIAHALAVDPLNSVSRGSNRPGGWEFSGVIDAEEFLGHGSWLLNVQAHSLRINPVRVTVQGGQVLHLKWRPRDDPE